MVEHVDLVVIGGGPAGMEAAAAAAEAGVKVALIDGYPQLGGQYYKQLSAPITGRDNGTRHSEAMEFFRRLADAAVDIHQDTVIWSVEPGATNDWIFYLKGQGVPETLAAKAVVAAPGVYDRPVPFPGWTLPGVVTAGGVQVMLKTQRIVPGRRFLFSGTGPLQMAVAAQLVNAGAEVAGLLEANEIGPKHVRYAPAMWGQWTKLREGFDYWRTLQRGGIKVERGRAAIAARGDGAVEAVVVARLDEEMRPIPGSERTVEVDTLVTGYGFLPNNDITRMLGCEHDYVPEQMYHIPRHDRKMQTSIPSVFVAGDGAGVGGVVQARLQGRIAGTAAACRLGKLKPGDLTGLLQRKQRALTRERRFARLLTEMFSLGPGLLSWADDDTLICRCEEITKKEITDSVKMGCETLIWAKRMTRAGMGMCQGRVCGQWIARLVADQTGQDPGTLPLDTVRPPLRPVALNLPEVPDHG